MWFPFIVISVLIVFQTGAVESKNSIKSDEMTTMKSAQKTIRYVIKKNNLDPSYKDYMEGNISTRQYKFYDMLMFGLSKCSVKKSSFDNNKHTNEFELTCPKLLYISRYAVNGSIEGQELKGLWVLSAKDVELIFLSNYTEETRHGKKYFYAKSTHTEAKVTGQVTIIKDVYYTETDKGPDATKSYNENQKLADKMAEQITAIMVQEFFNDVNKYMKNTPIDETTDDN